MLLAILLLSSCGEEKKVADKKGDYKKDENSQKISSINSEINANSLAHIRISGMVNEVKCVSSIKKLLSAMVGVTEIELNFNEQNHINHAMIKYDSNVINDQQMVNAIEKLNNGAYKVGDVEIKKLKEKSISVKIKSEENEITFTSSPSSESVGFALPNILNVFNIL
jgi:copper chaperone CopZ